MNLLCSSVLLLGWLAALRALAPVSDPEEPWSWRWDPLLALGGGLALGIGGSWWLASFHLNIWPLTASDFFQYCDSVGAVQHGQRAGFWEQRSFVAAQLPGLLARRYGVLGGLAVAAGVSLGLTGSALYLWGRAVYGRFAGVATVLLAGAVAPVVLLSRTVTFYPESVATSAGCAATAALAARFRTGGSLLAAGLGAGLVLLTDVRGLWWALPALGVAGFAALAAPWRWIPLRVGLLLAPVVASWWIGRAVSVWDAPGLATQTEAFVRDVVAKVGAPPPQLPEIRPEDDFLWGRSSPTEIPAALARAAGFARLIPPEAARFGEAVYFRMNHVTPWALPALGAALLAAFGVRRRPWSALALAGPLVPYLVSLPTAALVLTHPRYLAVSFAGLPVLLGVAAAVAGTRTGEGIPPRGRAPAGVLLLVLLVLGVVPSWLSPVAPWRIPQSAEQYPKDFQRGENSDGRTDRRCRQLVEEDAAEGRSWQGYTLPEGPSPLPAGGRPR